MSAYTNGHSAAILPLPTPTKILDGTGLAHRRLDKRQRAILAATVLDGQARFVPSRKQLSDLLDVSATYIDIARGLSPDKRAAILDGQDSQSFAELMTPPRQMSLAGPVIPNLKIISDDMLADLARVVGTERMLTAACAAEHR